jgi:DNA ligase-1
MYECSPQTISFILDAEIVAVDPIDGSLKSFQELSNRARKDVQLQSIQVAVGVFAFDLMYLDGEVRSWWCRPPSACHS